MDFKATIEIIARSQPKMTVAKAVEIALALEEPTFNLDTHEGLVAFAKTLPGVQENLADMPIRAIKVLRDTVRERGHAGGLRECKDAIDALRPARAAF